MTQGLRRDLTLLVASRKLQASGKPDSITQIVNLAILDLATRVRRGTKIAFLTVPRSPVRVSVRASRHAHSIAIHVSEDANVRISDFVRTAISLYVRKHGREITRLAERVNRQQL